LTLARADAARCLFSATFTGEERMIRLTKIDAIGLRYSREE
jgi:hypothetical protein